MEVNFQSTKLSIKFKQFIFCSLEITSRLILIELRIMVLMILVIVTIRNKKIVLKKRNEMI